jgi:Methyltransferase domain
LPREWLYRYDDWERREYRPTFFRPGDSAFLTERQAGLFELLGDINGKLDRCDYYKLYETAYFAAGPVLEVGRLGGKSTAIIAMALLDAGQRFPFYSIDLSSDLGEADRNLTRHEVRNRVILIQGDSGVVVRQLPGQFDVAFVDGDHSYEGVTADIFALRGRVMKQGAVMFHDFFHTANADPGEPRMKVAYAVNKHAPASNLAFRGGIGAIGLYEQL